MLSDREQQPSVRVSSPRPVRGKRSRTRRLYLSMSAAGVLISMLCLLLAICCLYHVAFCIIVVLFWVAQVNAAPMEALQMVLAHVRYTFILSVSMVGVLVPAAMAAMGLFSKKRHPDALCMYFLRGNLVCLVATVVAVAMLQQQLVELQTAWLFSSPKLELAFCVVSSLCVGMGFWTTAAFAVCAFPPVVSADEPKDSRVWLWAFKAFGFGCDGRRRGAGCRAKR